MTSEEIKNKCREKVKLFFKKEYKKSTKGRNLTFEDFKNSEAEKKIRISLEKLFQDTKRQKGVVTKRIVFNYTVHLLEEEDFLRSYKRKSKKSGNMINRVKLGREGFDEINKPIKAFFKKSPKKILTNFHVYPYSSSCFVLLIVVLIVVLIFFLIYTRSDTKSTEVKIKGVEFSAEKFEEKHDK